jgi:hypothetical protein
MKMNAKALTILLLHSLVLLSNCFNIKSSNTTILTTKVPTVENQKTTTESSSFTSTTLDNSQIQLNVTETATTTVKSSTSPPTTTEEIQTRTSSLPPTSNSATELYEDSISFGIRSFTVEVSSNTKVSSTTTAATTTTYEAKQTSTNFSPSQSTAGEESSTSKLSTEQPTSSATTTVTTVVEQSNEKLNHLPTTSISDAVAASSAADDALNVLKTNLNILFNDDDAETTARNQMRYTQTDAANSHENDIFNDMRDEQRMQNGLYRIKIGEITTDEFNSELNFNEAEEENKDKLPSDMRNHQQQPKVNIDDFFPSKISDFKPVIEISNERMLKEKNNLHNEEIRTTSGTFEADEANDEIKSGTRINTSNDASTTNIEIELIEDISSPSVRSEDDKASDDEIITLVEEIVTEKTVTINTDNVDAAAFIPRRTKKFDPSIKSNTQGPMRTHDFGMTKFSLDKTNKTQNELVNGKPEFSTTKFYNSKELYSEILHKKPTAVKTQTNPIREKLLNTNKVPIESTPIREPPKQVVNNAQQTSRPHVLSRLEEKLNTLDCDIQNLSADSMVWRGNETHELNLPITVSRYFL